MLNPAILAFFAIVKYFLFRSFLLLRLPDYYRHPFVPEIIMEESIYERERREKLQKLRELGVDPYGGRTAGLKPLADD